MTNLIKILKEVLKQLKPLSRKIEVAGSIRRKSPNPQDIDIVMIPKNWKDVQKLFLRKFKIRILGEDIVSGWYKGIQIDVFRAEPSYWGAMLMSVTGPRGSAIGMRIIARKKGMKLNQYGLWKGNKRIAGKTERSIYKALGKQWKPPELR